MANRFVRWTARIFAILYILFLSMFALDVFSEYSRILDILVALFMHMIPSFVVIIILVFAWKRPLVGAWAFGVLGIGFTLFFDAYEHIFSLLLISFPLFITACLFYIDHRIRKRDILQKQRSLQEKHDKVMQPGPDQKASQQSKQNKAQVKVYSKGRKNPGKKKARKAE